MISLLKCYRAFSFSRKIMTSSFSFLETSNGNKICYEKVEGSPQMPTIVCIPGFMSGKDGDKIKFVKELCQKKKYSFIRYDPTCIGESPGDWADVQFQDWVLNAATMIDQVGKTPCILFGSSMGGWISMYLATQEKYKERISGLVLIAPALNLFRSQYEAIIKKLPTEVVESLERGEVYNLEDEHGVTPLKKSFAELSVDYEIDLSKDISVHCPIRILHGMSDETIPHTNSLKFIAALARQDAELIFKKDAAHRFQEPDSLTIIAESLDRMVGRINMH